MFKLTCIFFSIASIYNISICYNKEIDIIKLKYLHEISIDTDNNVAGRIRLLLFMINVNLSGELFTILSTLFHAFYPFGTYLVVLK